MPIKKEIGSKLRKKILKSLFAPNVPTTLVLKNVQFIFEDEEGINSLVYNKKMEVRFFKFEDQFLPTLQFIRENPEINIPTVKVDQGAVPHILNGANIFAQGITDLDGKFSINSIVKICNPQNSLLSIGKSLKSSDDLLSVKGKVILNLHYLGDSIWNQNL